MSTQNVTAPHRHTTRVAHSPSLAARQGRHLDDHTGPLPTVDYVGRHRKPEQPTPDVFEVLSAFMKRYTGGAS